jgi:hypothetical protein
MLNAQEVLFKNSESSDKIQLKTKNNMTREKENIKFRFISSGIDSNDIQKIHSRHREKR